MCDVVTPDPFIYIFMHKCTQTGGVPARLGLGGARQAAGGVGQGQEAGQGTYMYMYIFVYCKYVYATPYICTCIYFYMLPSLSHPTTNTNTTLKTTKTGAGGQDGAGGGGGHPGARGGERAVAGAGGEVEGTSRVRVCGVYVYMYVVGWSGHFMSLTVLYIYTPIHAKTRIHDLEAENRSLRQSLETMAGAGAGRERRLASLEVRVCLYIKWMHDVHLMVGMDVHLHMYLHHHQPYHK